MPKKKWPSSLFSLSVKSYHNSSSYNWDLIILEIKYIFGRKHIIYESIIVSLPTVIENTICYFGYEKKKHMKVQPTMKYIDGHTLTTKIHF
jgi:hypothetical protein